MNIWNRIGLKTFSVWTVTGVQAFTYRNTWHTRIGIITEWIWKAAHPSAVTGSFSLQSTTRSARWFFPSGSPIKILYSYFTSLPAYCEGLLYVTYWPINNTTGHYAAIQGETKNQFNRRKQFMSFLPHSVVQDSGRREETRTFYTCVPRACVSSDSAYLKTGRHRLHQSNTNTQTCTYGRLSTAVQCSKGLQNTDSVQALTSTAQSVSSMMYSYRQFQSSRRFQ